MSKRMLFGTCVTDGERLKKSAERMRADGIQVVGPRFVSNYPMRNYAKTDAWAVKLPGWFGECAFAADGSGTMSGDNESEYYDERPLDLRTGERIDKDDKGQPYRVHPRVLSGEKQPGDDGRLGDIMLLRRLLVEYASIGPEEEAARLGGTIAYRNLDPVTGELELAIDMPEAF